MTNDSIHQWHFRSRPERTAKDFNINLGCHLEEFAEMLAEIEFDGVVDNSAAATLCEMISGVGSSLKDGRTRAAVPYDNRANFLKELCDGIVTGIGVGYCAGADVPSALALVDRSNWSKFVDGVPQYDANGKVAKPDTYQKPDLTGLY